MSTGSVVGIASGYGLDDRGVGVRAAVGSSLLHFVQTDSGAHPAYLMDIGGFSPGVKRPGSEADHWTSN
jgi:hypothetical protein